MKILTARPPLEKRCHSCNSTYELDPDDVTFEEDVICGKLNEGAPGLTAFWECPVCGNAAGDWHFMLPLEWQDKIRARGVRTAEQALARRYPNGYPKSPA